MTDLTAIIRPIVEGQIRAYLHAHPDNAVDHGRLVAGIGKRVTHDICAPDTVRRIELALRGAGCGHDARASDPAGRYHPAGLSAGGRHRPTGPELEVAPAPGHTADIEPVAVRFNFDGQGWTYADTGIVGYWQACYQDADLLYTAEALAKAEKRGRKAERAELIAWMRQDANESARNADIWAPASYDAKAMDKAADYLERMP